MMGRQTGSRREGFRQGSNSIQVRQFNERIVLQALRRAGEASKADLARFAGLTNNAIGDIIRDLISFGLVVECGKRHGQQRGQPATLLRLASGGAFGIGVRIGRVATEILCVDFDGKPVRQTVREQLLPPPEDVLTQVVDDIGALIEALPAAAADRLAGVGLALPYHLGSWLRELELPAATFKRWDDFDFAGELARQTGREVFVENDGNAAAIAELFYGIGRDVGDFAYVFIGGAVGGGIVIAGDCLRGERSNAGDFAMMPVPASALPSAPRPERSFDVLLTRASLAALRRHLNWHGVPARGLSDLRKALRTAPWHRAVDEWIEDAVAALVPALLSANAILDVPTVVIDGDIAEITEAVLVRLQAAMASACPESVRVPRFVPGSFGSAAGALGAATLPLFFHFSPRPVILTGVEGTAETAAGSARSRMLGALADPDGA